MVKDREEYPFRPRLGRPRTLGGRAAKHFLNRVLAAAARAGPGFSVRTGKVKRSLTVGRYGRGVGLSKVAGRRMRRAVVKARIVKLAGKGLGAARAHVRYIRRDGVGRQGEPGRLYNAGSDDLDGKAFVKRGEGDRHQFRFIVSADDADQLRDLKAFTRDLMDRMEDDLGTKLDWVAVDHYNTAHPHTHIVVRGVDDKGADLVIGRDYISHGMRRRASELATLELGPETDLEIQDKMLREVGHDRFTGIDRGILRDAVDGIVNTRGEPDHPYARFRHGLKLGRLRKLERMKLAVEAAPGLWTVADDLEQRLRRIGERGDIIKTMHNALARGGIDRPPAGYAIFDPAGGSAPRVVGRIAGMGLSNELHDRHYLIVDGVDGGTHYVDIGYRRENDDLAPGAIVEIHARKNEPKEVDRNIDRIARANRGCYGIEAHLERVKDDSRAYAQTHVRRLEYLRRANVADRLPDGTWTIPEDYLDRVGAFEAAQTKRFPVEVDLQSTFTLDRQVTADGATWLDRQLVGRDPASLRSTGFGREAEQALERRREHLIEQGLAEKHRGRIVFQRNLLKTLRDQDLALAGGGIARETGLKYRAAAKQNRIEGIYRCPVRLASGKYALIAKPREFTLVPWRPVLERNRGKQVSGVVRGRSISWTLTRARGRSIE